MRRAASLASPEADPVPARPFLKWAGGKGQLLRELRAFVPASFGRYHEAFLGGGALFFGIADRVSTKKRPRLSDVNAELISCYQVVRDDVEGLIRALSRHPYDKEHFYAVRAQDPKALSPTERAARTIFLNRTGYNGLYRVNSRGQFNVPFGRYTNPVVCNAPNLRACSRALAGARLEVADFSACLRHAQRGDLVYFDPPYVPVSETATFTSYIPGGFGWEQQQQLADTFRQLAREGVFVMLSNSDTPELRALYRDFRVESVKARRAINSRADRRGQIGEVVVLSY